MESLETALKNRFRLEMLPSDANHQGILAAGEMGWAVEPSALFGEDFSVDDLLDWGGNVEMEEKEAEKEEAVEEAEAEAFNISNSKSASTSAVSLDLLAPTELEFPVSLLSRPECYVSNGCRCFCLAFNFSKVASQKDDVEELEWVSRFFDDSFMQCFPCSETPTPSLKRPISSTGSMESLAPVKAKRSKRPRAAVGGVWTTASPLAALADSSSTSSNSCPSSPSSSSSSSSCLIYDPTAAGLATSDLVFLARAPRLAKKENQRKRGRKPKRPKPAAAGGGGGERRCSHCGAQKTPQWRTGPLGAKTLCNACGVRFKSGRLLPEYRPACSPTFLSHVHSNSHRKVLEMRRQKEEEEQQQQQQPLFAASSSSSSAAAALAVPVPVPSF